MSFTEQLLHDWEKNQCDDIVSSMQQPVCTDIPTFTDPVDQKEYKVTTKRAECCHIRYIDTLDRVLRAGEHAQWYSYSQLMKWTNDERVHVMIICRQDNEDVMYGSYILFPPKYFDKGDNTDLEVVGGQQGLYSLAMLNIHPKYQSCGLGTLALHKIFMDVFVIWYQKDKNKIPPCIYLNVHYQNKRAITFYRRNGFEVFNLVGEHKPDHLLMKIYPDSKFLQDIMQNYNTGFQKQVNENVAKCSNQSTEDNEVHAYEYEYEYEYQSDDDEEAAAGEPENVETSDQVFVADEKEVTSSSDVE